MRLFWAMVYRWQCCMQRWEDAVEGLHPVGNGAPLSFSVSPILLSGVSP